MSDDLDVLFTPLKLRNLTLRNRFVFTGMQRGFMNDGAPTQKMIGTCAAAPSRRGRAHHPASRLHLIILRPTGGR